MRFTLGALAPVLDASRSGPDVAVHGASQDSRAIERGMLFVPIVAERDGHEFIAAAVENGAAAYLTARVPDPRIAVPTLRVDDTARALGSLGAFARSRLAGPVVAITGSVGKTSTKDLCAATFGSRWRTHASTRSFNNEIGVPLTLCNTPDDCEATIVEMGARGVGHIAKLCAIATPTTAIVTAIGAAHLELFGDLDGVAQAKGEIVEALPSRGLAVLNADDARVVALRRRTSARVLTYGSAGDVRARDVVLDDELRARFVADTPWGSVDVMLGARGVHNVANALAALGAALDAGAQLDAAASALAAPTLSPWRMEIHRVAGGPVVINDAYNANPESMRVALDALAALPAHRRVAVLGPMAELGSSSAEAHRSVAARAAELGIEVLAVDTDAYGAGAIHGIDATLQSLAELRLGEHDAVLVKASRVAGLERLVARLMDADA